MSAPNLPMCFSASGQSVMQIGGRGRGKGSHAVACMHSTARLHWWVGLELDRTLGGERSRAGRRCSLGAGWKASDVGVEGQKLLRVPGGLCADNQRGPDTMQRRQACQSATGFAGSWCGGATRSLGRGEARWKSRRGHRCCQDRRWR